MISTSRYIWITEYIHPPEADRLASAFSDARAQINRSASTAEQVNMRLAQGWEGKQSARFLNMSTALPPEMRTCADWCGSQEQRFRGITVAVRRQVPNPDYYGQE
jgi:uncharacterized protein YukE